MHTLDQWYIASYHLLRCITHTWCRFCQMPTFGSNTIRQFTNTSELKKLGAHDFRICQCTIPIFGGHLPEPQHSKPIIRDTLPPVNNYDTSIKLAMCQVCQGSTVFQHQLPHCHHFQHYERTSLKSCLILLVIFCR